MDNNTPSFAERIAALKADMERKSSFKLHPQNHSLRAM
jgi:hypothetical protein